MAGRERDPGGELPRPRETRREHSDDEPEATPSKPVAGPYGSDSIRRPAAGEKPDHPFSVVRAFQQAAPFMGAAWGLTGTLLVGGLGGAWLDRRLESSPWCLLCGLLIGAGLGLYQVVRVATDRSQDGG